MSSNTSFTGIIAENYEKYMSPLFFVPYAKDIENRLPAKGISSLLEIACGTGQVTRLLRAKLPSARIVATDLNPDMIEVAKKAIPAHDRIEWMVADAQQIPFNENEFDVVLCQFGVMFFPEKTRAVKEAYRVIKPGGKFVFNTWDSLENNRITAIANDVVTGFFKENPPTFYQVPFSMHNPDEMKKLMHDAGFKDISIKKASCEGFSASSEDAARGLIMGTPMYASICERNEPLLPEIVESLSKAITKEFGNSSIRVPNFAWVAEGTK